MPTETGIFNEEETNDQYSFSYPIARWIGKFLPKDEQVIDFGCGRASYLAYLQDIGFQYLLGVEGEQQHFEIHNDNIIIQDLTKPFDLNIYGNVICLEVGEHIPKDLWHLFIENISIHIPKGGKFIYSHGIREQGGLGHINCMDNILVVYELHQFGFALQTDESVFARDIIGKECSWFKHSIMIFEKIK